MVLPPKKPACAYGCVDPEHCPWPHRGCRHCSAIRSDTGWAENPDKVLAHGKPYMKGHPL